MIHKTKFLTALVSIIAVLFFNSCSEETETLDPCVLSPCNGSSFQVDFGGATFIATQTEAEFTEDGVTISGAKANGERFEFSIDGVTTGTYNSDELILSYTENIAAAFSYLNQTADDDKNGSLTITAIDATNKTITGTFAFTGYYTDDVGAPRTPIEFTSGTFTIPYTGNGPNPNPNPNPSSGDYWPLAINNQWVFLNDGIAQDPMKIESTQVISGNTYYKFTNLFGQSLGGTAFEGEILARKQNSDYYVRQSVTIPASGTTPAITVSPLEILFLKDNLEVNGTWNQTLTQTTTIQGLPPIESELLIAGKIMEKDIDVTVNGQNYTDVIKVELIQTTQGQVNTNYYWFAKDIGPIKVMNSLNGQDINQELESYILN